MNKNMSNSIIINLNALEARDFHYQESFFQAELEQAVKIVKQQIQKSREKTQKLYSESNNFPPMTCTQETISVLGKRGTGKTSFMLTLQRYIKDMERGLNENLFFLPMIDPGMLEEAEYFIATLTSIICQEIRENNNFQKHEDQYFLAQWEETLKRLCEAFIALDSTAYKNYMEKSFQYPEVFGNYALMNGCSGIMLTRQFHKFIAQSIDLLNKLNSQKIDCFVLMIDDIDIAYDKTWTILENIRKYLASEQIIVIVGGDSDLFKLVIRNKLFNSSRTSELALREKFIKTEDILILKDVEFQYQLKLFPIVNRINLPSPYIILLTNPERFECRYVDHSGVRNYNLKDLFVRFVHKVFRYPEGHPATRFNTKNPYTTILPETNRVLMQLLKIMINTILTSENTDTNIKTPDLVYLFSNELSEFGFRSTMYPRVLYSIKMLRTIIQILVKKSIDEEYDPRYILLQPQYDFHERKNITILVFNELVCGIFSERPEKIFYYWLSFVSPFVESQIVKTISKDILGDILIQTKTEDCLPECSERIVKRVHNEMIANTDINTHYYYRKGPGFLRVVNNPNERFRKSFPDSQEKNNEWKKFEWINTVQRIMRKMDNNFSQFQTPKMISSFVQGVLTDWNTFCSNIDDTTLSILLPFSVAISDTAGEHYYVNFQRGIGVIAEVIKSVYNENDKDVNDIVRREIEKWCAHEVFTDFSDIQENSELLQNTIIDKVKPFIISSEIVDALTYWINNYSLKDIKQYPIETIVNIWHNSLQRFQYLSDSVFTEKLSAGRLLNECTISLLHSTLMEEIKINSGGNIKFPGSQEDCNNEFDIMERRLEKQTEGIEIPFFEFWLNCPFINSFLSLDQTKRLNAVKGFQAFKYKWRLFFHGKQFDNKALYIEEENTTAYNILCALMPVKSYSETELEETKIKGIKDSLVNYFRQEL